MQMTVKQLRDALAGMADDLPVFFRRVTPICGNIEEAGSARVDRFGFFGQSLPCVIVEPMQDEDGVANSLLDGLRLPNSGGV